MPYYDFQWTPAIEEHIAQHGIAPDEFEHVIRKARRIERSKSSDRRLVRGFTPGGRHVVAIFEMLDEITVLPVTCYEVTER